MSSLNGLVGLLNRNWPRRMTCPALRIGVQERSRDLPQKRAETLYLLDVFDSALIRLSSR
jgi:hypothetical protein